jgi:uncharacterized protein with FMN-binding domain
VVNGVRRIVLWVMSTLTVVTLLFGYHTSTSSQAAAGAESSALAPVASGTGGTSSTDGTSSTGSSSSDPGSGTTVTGDEASTRWGPVQVQLSVSGGTITDVTVVEYPNGNGRDQEINARALPILVQETLDAQGDGIDMVSGATVTSEGYLESLQSALDKAGL